MMQRDGMLFEIAYVARVRAGVVRVVYGEIALEII